MDWGNIRVINEVKAESGRQVYSVAALPGNAEKPNLKLTDKTAKNRVGNKSLTIITGKAYINVFKMHLLLISASCVGIFSQ